MPPTPTPADPLKLLLDYMARRAAEADRAGSPAAALWRVVAEDVKAHDFYATTPVGDPLANAFRVATTAAVYLARACVSRAGSPDAVTMPLAAAYRDALAVLGQLRAAVDAEASNPEHAPR